MFTPQMRGDRCGDGGEIKHGKRMRGDKNGRQNRLVRMQMFSMARLVPDIDLSVAPGSMPSERGLLGNIPWPIGAESKGHSLFYFIPLSISLHLHLSQPNAPPCILLSTDSHRIILIMPHYFHGQL